jgi:hypothetical protein
MFVEYVAFIFFGVVSAMLVSAKHTENTQNQAEQKHLEAFNISKESRADSSNTPRRSDDGQLGRNMS